MLSTAGILVLIAFLVCALIQIVYIIFIYGRLASFKGKPLIRTISEPVSIIIAARNEIENLKNNLDSILSQDYEEFEVLVVNDGSTDGSKEWLDDKAGREKKLRVIHRMDADGSKKFAIIEGIEKAKYSVLLFTDADCKTNSKNWIITMLQYLHEKKSIGLGYGAYLKKKGIMNKLIRLDTVLIATQYLSFALCKIPYMGVGRNLSYKKQLWKDNGGFVSHLDIKSGDDDLFISEAANAFNTSIQIHPDSFTYSEPESNLFDWIKQKSRHLGTFSRYSKKTIFFLNLYNISYLLFIVFFIFSFFVTLSPSLSVSVYLMRLIPHIIIFTIIMNRFKEKDLIILTPILEPLLLFIYPLVILKSKTNKTIIWK